MAEYTEIDFNLVAAFAFSCEYNFTIYSTIRYGLVIRLVRLFNNGFGGFFTRIRTRKWKRDALWIGITSINRNGNE